LPLDVIDDASLEALPGRIREHADTLDLVVHAAGILHDGELQPEKALAQCDRAHLLRTFEVNSLGPLLTARAVLPLMPKDRPAAFAALSAMVGSIGDNRLGGWYGYRASKAALNQFLRTLAIEARRRYRQLRVLAIHPGTTDTELSRPFQGNVPDDKLYTPAQSAGRILAVIDGTTADDSGGFFNWNGERIAW
jgi:NAD(P)-dependent dehydrogenase (short-subunit alcohol dehydrogenase family)